MIRHTIILLLSTLTLLCSGQQAITNFRNNTMLRYANISLLVKDVASGKTIEEFNSHSSVIPASTMKIVTTASALEMLGENFQFATTLETDGEIKPDGTLDGNLYIKGGGDPTLGSEKVGEKSFLPVWVDAVKKAGIKRIAGSIIACEYCLERQVINPRWTWEDMGNYYAPGIHSISYLDNTYKLYFNSGKLDSTPQILRTEPMINALQFTNFVKSTDTKSDNAYIYGAPYEYNRSIYGEIPANKTDFFIKGDIPHPAVLLAADFKQALTDADIQVRGNALVKMDNPKSKILIYKQLSPPLSDVIKEINVNSNNHFAEYTFKQLSVTPYSAGSNNASTVKIQNFWKDKGISTDELFQNDGSGLSPTNAVSANFYVNMLIYMKTKSASATVFYNSLPVSGTNGTLKNFLANTVLQGKVHAKSGTIARVKSYAGYIEYKNRTYAFAILVNNANGSSKEVTAKIENLLLDICKSSKL